MVSKIDFGVSEVILVLTVMHLILHRVTTHFLEEALTTLIFVLNKVLIQEIMMIQIITSITFWVLEMAVKFFPHLLLGLC